jgi:TPR repeat protein
MKLSPQRLSVLTLSILAGCTNPTVREGNPFDERLAAHDHASQVAVDQRVAPALPLRRAAHESPKPGFAEQAKKPNAEAVIISTPAQATTFNPEPNEVPISAAPSLDSAQMAMAEAKRLGAAGDQDAMLELMQQSAFMGNYDALYELARIYQNGIGVPKDMGLAIAYLTTGDGYGHLESTRVLAWNYLLGNGVPQDQNYGVMLFEKAAAGSTRAKREYGMLLANLVKPGLNDSEKGIMLLRQASDAGDPEASFRLSEALSARGQASEAETARTLAISRGYQVPSTTQGPILTQLGVTSEVKAEELKSRALAGDTNAIFNYANGLLLGKYPSIEAEFDAYCWFSVAMERGHPKAKGELLAIQGVKTSADAKTPGRLDQCVADLHQAITR